MFLYKLYQQPLEHFFSIPKKTVCAGIEYIEESYQRARSLLGKQEELLLEVDRLKKQIHELKIKHGNLKNELLTSRRHNRFMDKLSTPYRLNIKTARVISSVLTPLKQIIIANIGEQDGAYEGQAALAGAGVVGRIVSLTPLTSTTMLISDPKHLMNVEIERTGSLALAAGIGRSRRIDLLHINEDVKLRIGDKVVTSSLDQTYPSGYPVGEIVSIRPSSGDGFASVSVRPYANLGHEQEIILTWSQNEGEGK